MVLTHLNSVSNHEIYEGMIKASHFLVCVVNFDWGISSSLGKQSLFLTEESLFAEETYLMLAYLFLEITSIVVNFNFSQF
mgnify:CR=1 FL=1